MKHQVHNMSWWNDGGKKGQKNLKTGTNTKSVFQLLPWAVPLMQWGQSERWSYPVWWRGPGRLRMGLVVVSPGRPARRLTPLEPCASAGSLYPTPPPRTRCSRSLRHARTRVPCPRRAPPERRRTRCLSWCPPIVWGRGVYLVWKVIQIIELRLFCQSESCTFSPYSGPVSEHTITQEGVSEAKTSDHSWQRVISWPRFNPSLYRSHFLLLR